MSAKRPVASERANPRIANENSCDRTLGFRDVALISAAKIRPISYVIARLFILASAARATAQTISSPPERIGWCQALVADHNGVVHC
jgi:hypothetical protein